MTYKLRGFHTKDLIKTRLESAFIVPSGSIHSVVFEIKTLANDVGPSVQLGTGSTRKI